MTTTAGNKALSSSDIPGLENLKPHSHVYNDFQEAHVDEERSGHAYEYERNSLYYDPSSLLETAGPTR